MQVITNKYKSNHCWQNIPHGLISAGPNSPTDRVFLWLHLSFLNQEIQQTFLYAFTWVMKMILCSCTRSLWIGSSIWRSFFWETQIPADTEVRAKPTNWLMSAKESHVGSFERVSVVWEVKQCHKVKKLPGLGFTFAAAKSPLGKTANHKRDSVCLCLPTNIYTFFKFKGWAQDCYHIH